MLAGLIALLALVEGRVVTLHDVTTLAPTTITASQAPTVVTNQETDWVSTTIFEASTFVKTIATGTINTEPLSSKSNPVTQFDTYSTAELSNTINPSTYSTAYTVITPSGSADAASTSEPGQQSSSSSTAGSPSATASGASSAALPSASSSQQLISSSVPYAASTSVLGASSSSTLSSSGTLTTSPAYQSTASSASSSLLTSSSLASSSSLSESSTSAASSVAAVTTSSASPASSSQPAAAASSVSGAYSGPIFDAISSDEPLSMFSREGIPLSVPNGYDTSQVMQTNKFYDNFLLNDQDLTAFAQPYGVFYSTDSSYYGVGISYTNESQRVFGPDASANPVEYYTNPLMLKSLVLSAKEFTNSDLVNPIITDMGPFSVNMTLKTQNCWPNQALTVPVAIGMGFVTGIYDGYTPRLFSQIGINKIVKDKSVGNFDESLQKYVLSLANGIQWNVYVRGPQDFEFKAVSDFEVMGNVAASGADSIIVQAAVVVSNEDSIDAAAGAFPVGADLDGETSGTSTTYRIAYDVRGNSKSQSTLLYALPHHVDSFTGATQAKTVNGLTVYSSNKGWLTGVLSNTLEMVEDVSDSPGWLVGTPGSLSAEALQLLAKTVNEELAEDMKGQTDTTSTYTAGKSFDKFAYILLVASEILENKDVTKEGLDKLKSALSPWLSNTQPTPFIYDTLCKGVTSSAANAPGGSPMSDFGAPFYNDHHFHYGYYVHTAAVIGLLDKKVGDGTWIEQHKDWVNSLIRDVANPSPEDPYFPVSRMFDYFSGHSWAHGMFQSGDGKDEESTSEDYNFAYGMKLWGQVSGDKEMEARGDLMLAILKRSMNLYFLFKDDNKVQPSNIIGNRVAGIAFENKLDHTTYFGTNLEYIQGIQMIPLTPASVLIREKDFVQQEWNSLLAPIVGSLNSGWAGILRANQALFDPVTSYNYFASDHFQSSDLDGGASRSWYLAFSGLLGGSSGN